MYVELKIRFLIRIRFAQCIGIRKIKSKNLKVIRAQTGIDMFAKDVKIWTASPNHGFFLIEEIIKIFVQQSAILSGALKLKMKFYIELCTVHLKRTGI